MNFSSSLPANESSSAAACFPSKAVEEIARLVVGTEQPLDLNAELGIGAAGVVEVGDSAGGRKRQRSTEYRFNLLPFLGRLDSHYSLSGEVSIFHAANRRNWGRTGATVSVGSLLPVLARGSLRGPSDQLDRNASYNQALARAQSDFTVRGETSSAAAVSSTLSPPKYLHSTTRACRGFIFSSSANASSRSEARPVNCSWC
jgi:hypothetical protein